MGGSAMGRPCKLTAEVQARLAEAIAGGNTYKVAAAYAGIDYSTFRLWMVKGEGVAEGRDEYSALFDAIKEAENEAVRRRVELIDRAAEKNWTAAAWWLERRHPEDWGRHEKIDLDVALREDARRLAPEIGLTVEEALEELERFLLESRA